MTSVLDELNAIKAKIASIDQQLQSHDPLAADAATLRAMAARSEAYAESLRTTGHYSMEPFDVENVARDHEAYAALFRTVAFLAEKHIETH